MINALRKKLEAEPIFGRVLRSMSWLYSSHIVMAIMGLIYLAVAARALGPMGLGILAIVEAYLRITSRLLRLEPWQAVIKYGIEAQSDDDTPRFARLIKLSIVIDLLGGLLAGGVGLALATFAAPLLGLPEEGHQYLWLVCLTLFFSFRSTGIAILRIYDRFDTLAKLDMVLAGFRLALALAAYALGLGLWAFLLILTIHSILDGCIILLAGLREFRRRKQGPLRGARLRPALSENVGFVRMLWNSNINVILRQSTQRFDIILLSALLGPTAVGFYHIAKRSADAALRLGQPLNQAIYPEIARVWASGDVQRFRRIVTRTSLVICLVGLVVFVPVALNMEALLRIAFGAEFGQAALLVTIQMLAVVIYLGGIILNPTMLSMGRDRELVRITLLAMVVFFVAFVPLVLVFEAPGASLAHVVFNIMWAGGCFAVFLRETSRIGSHST